MRAMYRAVSPNGITPWPRLAAQTASQTLIAAFAGTHSSKPRSPVKPVRETRIGTLAMVVLATPKYGSSVTNGVSAARMSRERGPWTARTPQASETSSMATSSRPTRPSK